MSTEGGISSAEFQGFTVESNSSTKEEILDSLSGDKGEGTRTATPPAKAPETDEERRSKAGSELGKAGGKASAEKRAEAKGAKEQEKQKEEKAEPEAKTSSDKEESGPEADEESEDKPESKLGKPRHDPRARMLEATRKEAEAKRERDAAKAELERLRAEYERLRQGAQPPSDLGPPKEGPKDAKPDPANFEDYEAYLDARDEYNKRRWTEEVSEQRKHESALDHQNRILAQHIEVFRSHVTEDVVGALSEEVRGLRPEFQLQPGDVPGPENWIANEIVFSPEHAPALLLHLSEHPDEFQRIAALSNPRAVSREMAKLEARLEAATAGASSTPEVVKSKAPPPIKPVVGTPYVAAEDSAPKPNEDFDAWFRRNRKDFHLPQR